MSKDGDSNIEEIKKENLKAKKILDEKKDKKSHNKFVDEEDETRGSYLC